MNNNQTNNAQHGEHIVNIDDESPPNPFARSSKIARSPKVAWFTPNANTNTEGEKEAKAAQQAGDNTQKSLRRRLEALECTIRELSDFVASKNNVHAEIKKKIAKAMIGVTAVMKDAEKMEEQVAVRPTLRFADVVARAETPKRPITEIRHSTVEKRRRSPDELKERPQKTRRREDKGATPRSTAAKPQNGQKAKIRARPRADASGGDVRRSDIRGYSAGGQE